MAKRKMSAGDRSRQNKQKGFAVSIQSETLIAFQQARDCFPGRKRVGNATMHRWRSTGVRGVVLETLIVGGLRFTSVEAIQRFIDAQNARRSQKRSAQGLADG